MITNGFCSCLDIHEIKGSKAGASAGYLLLADASAGSWIKNRRLLTKLGISEHGIYLFAGPSGNGRHITGSALAGSLMASYGLEPEETGFLALRADDFPENGNESC